MSLKTLLKTSLSLVISSLLIACQTLDAPNVRACKMNPRTGEHLCAWSVTGPEERYTWEEWSAIDGEDGLTQLEKSISITDEGYLEVRRFIERSCNYLGRQCKWPEINEALTTLENGIGL